MSTPTETSTIQTFDHLQAAVCKAFGHKVTTGRDNTTGRVFFVIHGDVEGTLARIFRNEPVGVRTLMESIKEIRRTLFSEKGWRG